MNTVLILKAIAGDLTGQEFAFNGPVHAVLGRSRSCTLRLPGDATVSRQHCLLEIDAAGVWAQDLGSLNGTLVNGTKIGQRVPGRPGNETMVQPPRQELGSGDELRICNNLFQVEIVKQPINAPEEEVSHAKRDSSGCWNFAMCS